MSTEDRNTRLEQIQEQIRHLTGLLEDILAISRAESVGLTLNRTPLDLASLCTALVSEFQGTSPRRSISLRVVGRPRRLNLDAKLIRQAISNLISNAIKYSPEDSAI